MVNLPYLSCLIRADGDVSGIEGIQIPGRLARLAEGKDLAYLIDIEDRFSTWASTRADARERLYRSQQWKPTTTEEILNDLGNRTRGGD